jgi:hypothetical protein
MSLSSLYNLDVYAISIWTQKAINDNREDMLYRVRPFSVLLTVLITITWPINLPQIT